jgi:hypothetical protein
MKTAVQIANHPKARLQQEVVARLRVFGSIEGAKLAWQPGSAGTARAVKRKSMPDC